MLLRRIIDHFRKQEWTAIGIDFVIVVVGVFIGIQAADWNEARAENVRAHDILGRFQDDLQADLANYEVRVKFWRDVADHGEAGLRFVADRRSAGNDHWPVIIAFFQASQVGEFWTISATFDELKSAGELNLVRDVALRGALSGYYLEADNPTLTERPAYRENVRGLIPMNIQRYIWDSCYSSTWDGGQQFYQCESPISEAEAAALANSLANNDQLVAELRYWMSTMHIAQIIGENRAVRANDILAVIDSELKK